MQRLTVGLQHLVGFLEYEVGLETSRRTEAHELLKGFVGLVAVRRVKVEGAQLALEDGTEDAAVVRFLDDFAHCLVNDAAAKAFETQSLRHLDTPPAVVLQFIVDEGPRVTFFVDEPVIFESVEEAFADVGSESALHPFLQDVLAAAFTLCTARGGPEQGRFFVEGLQLGGLGL